MAHAYQVAALYCFTPFEDPTAIRKPLLAICEEAGTKGTLLLGVKAVIAESYERIHRSNLIGMGVLPLQFSDGDSANNLALDGTEIYAIDGLATGEPDFVTVRVTNEGVQSRSFAAKVRIDTPKEWDYYRHGGILHYVLRQLVSDGS